MRIIPLFGASTRHKSEVVTVQRRLNCYYENRPDQDKTKVVIYGTPGLVPQFTINISAPVRAMAGTETALYLITANRFCVVDPMSGAILFSAMIGSYIGVASIAISPTQVVIVDGTTGYLYTIATQILTTIT